MFDFVALLVNRLYFGIFKYCSNYSSYRVVISESLCKVQFSLTMWDARIVHGISELYIETLRRYSVYLFVWQMDTR